MSHKPLDSIGGLGGPVQLAPDPGRARNIHVTVTNPTAVTHGVFFARSLREISDINPNSSFPGFALVAVPNSVASATIGTIAYTSILLQGWIGELWAVADIGGGIIGIEVMDSGYSET